MKIILLGAAGFIGTNLVIELAKNPKNIITVVDRDNEFFKHIIALNLPNLYFIESELTMDIDYEELVFDQDLVYHLVSTTVPTTSNQHIAEEFVEPVELGALVLLLEAHYLCLGRHRVLGDGEK